jgi:tRNA-splicing ligase RtcB
MGRLEACRTLRREECDAAMRGIVFDGWRRLGMDGRHRDLAGKFDLEEAPAAYKPIEAVMAAQRDLVEPVVRLRPLGVVKG